MEQLSSLDGQLIHVESEEVPEHIATLTIYDQSTAEGGIVRFKDILRLFESRLSCSPILTNKIKKVPLNIEQPFWVADPNFDLEYHLRHIALPQPGDWRQLCIQISRLHAMRLNSKSPLWQAYIIEGLNNVSGVPKGSFAMYLKVHHAVADGMAAADMYMRLHDLKPIKPTGEYGSQLKGRHVPKEPSGLKLLSAASGQFVKRPFQMMEQLANAIPDTRKRGQVKESMEYEEWPKKVPTRFDQTVSNNRVFSGFEVPFSEISEIRKVVEGATVNDVAVAIVSGALRTYLSEKGELGPDSIVSWIPVNVRSNLEKGAKSGNNFSTIAAKIHTNIADPIERFNKICESISHAKKLRELTGDDALMKLVGVMPPYMQKALGKIVDATASMGNSTFPANMTVSNVPGSPVPLYLAGAKAVKFQGVGILQQGHGLFHTISSYCGTLTISFLSCRAHMPDPEHYHFCVRESYVELRDAAYKYLANKEGTQKAVPKESTAKKAATKKSTAKKTVAKKAAPKKATLEKKSDKTG